MYKMASFKQECGNDTSHNDPQEHNIKRGTQDEKSESCSIKGASKNVQKGYGTSKVLQGDEGKRETDTSRKRQACEEIEYLDIGRSTCKDPSPVLWKDVRHAKVSGRIDNLCQFQCPTCKKIYTSRHSMCQHFLKTRHSKLEHRARMNTFLVKIVAYKCETCSKKLICERRTILEHLSIHTPKTQLKD